MKKNHGLLLSIILGAAVAFGIGYGFLHAGLRPTGPEAGMIEEVLVTAPRADRVVEEIVVTAKGPILVLPVVEVRARREYRQLAGRLSAGDARVN